MQPANDPASLSVTMPAGTRCFRVLSRTPRNGGELLTVISSDGLTYGTYPATMRVNGSVADGSWHMVSATFDSETHELTLRGIFRSSATQR